MDWTSDALGRLALPGIHDASLVRLVLDAEARKLELRLRGAAGEKLRLAFADVELIGGAALAEAAIVNTIFLWPVRDVPVAFHDDPSAGWRHLFEGRIGDRDRRTAERRRLSETFGNGYLATMVCSYGGDLSVLAGSFHVDDWG